MEENKDQRKEGEDKRVFFWFRDDAAVDAQSHSAAGKVRVQSQPEFPTFLMKKSPIGLFINKPEPVQEEACPT